MEAGLEQKSYCQYTCGINRLVDDFTGTDLSVPFCPYLFVQCHFIRISFCPIPLY